MSPVSSETLTFLFTDLERSTRLWEEQPELMSAALARHDELVNALISARGGTVFATTGDGVCAAFGRANGAARAAVEIQAALADEPWPDILGSLRVRMGMHTGEAEIRDANYFGPALNRAARLMAIAWGGQVICTGATASLLSDDFELCDLGEHTLRDLSRPERVWQLGSERFPPLRSGANLPGNLPTQATEFVGRETELYGVREAMNAARIVTLTGVGGAGKTRLALQYATEVQDDFQNGAWLCELAPLTSPDAVGPLLASVLRVDPGDDGWDDAIADSLASRQLLLILDNCEHVLDAVVPLTNAIVRKCADVRVLATSREGLGVAGERIQPVGSLTLPGATDPPDAARSADAVRLFVSRACDLRPLTMDDDVVAAIVHVCRRLDGIPLAIELAAARTQSLSVAEIARHLDDRFRLLTRGARSALGRHQTLRAAIDWSFDLLNEGERRVLTRASVFAGGFTLDAASTVCDPEATAPLETLDYVDGLVRRSLFIVDDAEPATRYRMLETIRQYAAERLEMSDDPVAIGRAHLDWAVAFTRDAADGLRGPDDAAWIARMEHELGNIRVALQFAASIHDLDSATTLLASAPIGALWDNRLGTSMAAMAKELAPEIGEPDHPVTAALLSLLALDAALRYSGEEAVALATRAREVAQRHDDWLRTGPWLAWLLSSLIAHDDQTLQVAASEALNRAIAENDTFAVAEWHAALGIAHWMRGDVDEAQRLTDTALALAEENRADNLVMRNAFLRGVSLLVPGSDPAAAMPYFQRAVRLGERVGGNVLFGGAAWAMLLSDGGDRTMSAASLARQLAEHLATPMFLIDADGMMVFFNDATAAILGTTFAEVGEIPSAEFGRNLDLGTTDGQPLRRRDTPAGVAFFQQRPIHQTLRATGYDGRRNTYDATAHPLFGAAGEMEGVVCVFWEHGHVSEAR